jgi:DNA-directed RNA polymerase subunit RPC12/RpoP
MSYTECAECGKRLWWDDVEYEEIDGEILCFDCITEEGV